MRWVRSKNGGGTRGRAILMRFTALLLCMLMLGAVVSCAGAAGDDPTVATTSGQTDADRFRGEVLTVLSADAGYALDGAGNAVSRALFSVDGLIRDRLGITVSYEMRSADLIEDRAALLDAVVHDAESGVGQYDLFRLPALTATEAAICGAFMEFPNAIEGDGISFATLSGKRMLAFGAFDPDLIETVPCIAVSGSLLRAAGIASDALLQMALEGGFTLEAMMRLGAEREVIPFAATEAQAVTLYYGAGFGAVDTAWRAVVHADLTAGEPTAFFSVFSDLMRQNGCPENTLGVTLFSEGRLLMMPIGLSSMSLLTDASQTGAEILLLPLPKRDAGQSEYRFPLMWNAPTYAVSSVTERGALSASVLRFAAEHGTDTVVAAFLETLCGTDSAENELRVAVFGAAVRGARYDLGYTASDLIGGGAEVLLKRCASGTISEVQYDEAVRSLSDAIDALFGQSDGSNGAESEESDANSSMSP